VRCGSARSLAGVTAAQGNGRQPARPCHKVPGRRTWPVYVSRERKDTSFVRRCVSHTCAPGPAVSLPLICCTFCTILLLLCTALRAGSCGCSSTPPRQAQGATSTCRRVCGAAGGGRAGPRARHVSSAEALTKKAPPPATATRVTARRCSARCATSTPRGCQGAAEAVPAQRRVRRGVNGLSACPRPSQDRAAALRRARPKTQAAGSGTAAHHIEIPDLAVSLHAYAGSGDPRQGQPGGQEQAHALRGRPSAETFRVRCVGA